MLIFGKDTTKTPAIIAEIGVNHEGNLNTALELIELAAKAGADAVKFQSYTPARFCSASDPVRLERVSRFSFDEQQHQALFQKAKEHSIEFLSTPVTEDWVEFLSPNVSAFKIASGDLTFEPVIRAVAKTGKPIILSTGLGTLEEIDQATAWVKEEIGEQEFLTKFSLMQCVSAYPTPPEDANVRSVPFLKERYKCEVGYSNHTIGPAACFGALALGANIIEVHFTDCKEGREFRDHQMSFDFNDLKNLVELAPQIKQSLGTSEKVRQNSEVAGLAAMRKGIVAARNLSSGQILTEEDLMFARPATEFLASDINSLIGKTININLKSGETLPKKSVV